MRDGKHANNPWFRNCLIRYRKLPGITMLPLLLRYAEELGYKEFDVVTVKDDKGYTVDLPVLSQPGQAQGTVSIALGYGRTKLVK